MNSAFVLEDVAETRQWLITLLSEAFGDIEIQQAASIRDGLKAVASNSFDIALIDLSLPRNIDPALPGVVDLGMLRAAASPDIAEKLLALSDEIIESYAAEYERLVSFENRAE